MAKVMCNWAPHCENIYCVHRHPHNAYPTPSKNGNPQCEDKGVFCQSENRAVNCVPVQADKEISIMADKMTTIQVSVKTKDRLTELGNKGDTYEIIIRVLLDKLGKKSLRKED